MNDLQTFSDERDRAGNEGKYLTFSLGGEEFGMGILKVREIIGIMPVTSLPQAPPYVLGVINLRGKVIPVIDLRLKFGMPPQEPTSRTCIIVAELSATGGNTQIGIIVDSVSEVLNIQSDEIEAPPPVRHRHYHRLHHRHGQDRGKRKDPHGHRPGVGRGRDQGPCGLVLSHPYLYFNQGAIK